MNLVIESTEHMQLEELRRLESYVHHQIAIRETKMAIKEEAEAKDSLIREGER